MKDADDFPLHALSWLSSTRSMTREERGDYIDLLALQWDNDGLPSDLDAFSRSIGYKNAKKLSAVLISKFPISSDGKRRNPRLEIEREKQRDRILKSRDRIGKMNLARGNKALETHSIRGQNTSLVEALQEPLIEANNGTLEGPPLTHTHTHTHTQESNSPIVLGAEAPPGKKPRGPKPRGPKPQKREPVPAESEEACQRFAVELGCHWMDGRAFWCAMEESKWTKHSGKTPILDWRATMRTYAASGYFQSQKHPGMYDHHGPPPWETQGDAPAVEIPDIDGERMRAGYAEMMAEHEAAANSTEEFEFFSE